MTLRNTIPGVWVWLMLTLPCFYALATTNDPPDIPDRYLLIVDTSSPMRSRARTAEESIAGLLASGIQGQIRDGDELGVWTFNNDLHTGGFELVRWKESGRDEIARSVLEFLDKQRFSKSTDFSKVMPHLMDVVTASKRITVIMVSDGDEAIQGTPFDDAIATYYQANAKAIKDKRAPIITVLRGYHGSLIGHSLSYPPWPIEFPAFPPEPAPEPEPEPEPTPAAANVVGSPLDLSSTLLRTNTGPIVFAEPLIVSGPSRRPSPPASPKAETNDLAEGVTRPAITSAQPTSVASANPGAGVPPEGASASGPGRDDRSFSSAYVIIPALGVMVVVVVAVGVLRMRRSRARRHASLITQSMDKKSGPE